MTTCLDDNHWNLYDRNCIKCKSEVRESDLLNDEEYLEWLEGKITLGLNLMEKIQVVK